MVLTSGKREKKIYDGAIKYKDLFDYLNIYSETFFGVGEEKARSTDTLKVEKPWASEKLPEITKESGNDICFKVDGTVCVILINKEKPSDPMIDTFNALQNHLSPKIDRGIKFKFGWINSTTQNAFISSIELQLGDGPKMILVNPGSRKRFYVMEGELIDENMKSVFEKLAGGELRFKNFAKNTIPDLE